MKKLFANDVCLSEARSIHRNSEMFLVLSQYVDKKYVGRYNINDREKNF